LPLNELRGTNSRETIKRIEIFQLPLTDDPNVDPTLYNFDKTYLKIKIRVSPTLVPEFREQQHTISEVLPKQNLQKKVSIADRTILEFNDYIQELIKNLSIRYSDEFDLELEREDIQSQSNLFIDNTSSNSRRKQFIESIYKTNDFISMKENLLKMVKKLVCFKYEKQGPVMGVTRDTNDQFYSE